MARSKEPAIVSHLGRPETPEETAARKAENSRKHRANQTALNLIGALLASLAIVAFLIVVVVRPEPGATDAVDYRQIASEVDAQEPLLAPALPESWSANSARYEIREEVPTWYVGFIAPPTESVPGSSFIALNQGIGANPTWLASVLERAESSGTESIDGIDWVVYDQRDSRDIGNFAYVMSSEIAGSTVVLHGTADPAQFILLASAIAAEGDIP